MIKQSHLYKILLTILLLTQLLSAIPFETGSMLGITWGAWIVFSFFYALNICFERDSTNMKFFALMLFAFWAMNVVSFYISPKQIMTYTIEVDTLVYLKSITIVVFTYFPFYYFAKHGYINEYNLKGFVVVLFILFALNIFEGNIIRSKETLEEHNVLNQTYLIVQLFPLFFIYFRRMHLLLLVSIAAILVLWGAKRGAIVCVAVDLLIFLIYLLREETAWKKYRGVMVFMTILMGSFLLYYITGNDFLQERLFTTGSEYDLSGQIRTDMYETLYGVYLNTSNASEILFGHGLAQTVSYAGNLAHQDWIELLIDNGLVGLFMYIILIIMCIKDLFKLNRSFPKNIKYALVCCVMNWCLMATYSMVYASREAFVILLSLGILKGIIRRYNVTFDFNQLKHKA